MSQSKRKRRTTTENTVAVKKSKKQNEDSKPIYSYWLMKSEPESRIEKGIDVKFGINELKECKDQTSSWDGVRNYQARNFMKDMKIGQHAFFYHSNCKKPGIAGIIEIVKEAYPDHTQFEKDDIHYDSTSDPTNPRWVMVDVQYVRDLRRYISLEELKRLHINHAKTDGPLKALSLFTRARLSVQPITEGISQNTHFIHFFYSYW